MSSPPLASSNVVDQTSIQPELIQNQTTDIEAVAPVQTGASDVPYSVFSPSRKRAICAAATCSALFSPLATNIFSFHYRHCIGLTCFCGDDQYHGHDIYDTAGYCANVLGFFRRRVWTAASLPCDDHRLRVCQPGSRITRFIRRTTGSSNVPISRFIGHSSHRSWYYRRRRGTYRTRYMGLFSAGVMVAPALAPVFGGALSETSYGWRALFWFLFAAGAALLTVLFVWMPETGRNIVGNGSIPPRGINMSLLDMFSRRQKQEVGPVSTVTRKPHQAANPLRCIAIISQKDVGIVLLANGLIYTGFYCVTVGFSSQMATVYNLTTLKIGLCFLPYGAGCSMGSIVVGRLLDYEFRKFARKSGYGDGRSVRQNSDFPLERARMSSVWYLVAVVAADTLIFGWTFRANISIAVPLVLLFINGFGITGLFTFEQVLLVDLYPQESASVTAANNLVRCLLGAAGSAVVDRVISAIGMGWTYTIVTAMILLSIPLLIAELLYGQKWRRARFDKLQELSKDERRVEGKPERAKNGKGEDLEIPGAASPDAEIDGASSEHKKE